MRTSHLQMLRLRELDDAAALFPERSRILEVGAGAGWQALELERRGHDVRAVDVADSPYAGERVFPVVEYDGRRFPFPDRSFDVVYSSNVLEHVRRLVSFEAEIHRVLTPEGLAIHTLPTSSWRLWTTLAFPAHLARRIHERARRNVTASGLEVAPLTGSASGAAAHGWRRWAGILIPRRHGEVGNVLTELYMFSGWRWRRHFTSTGWHLRAVVPARLTYTGYSILGSRLGLNARRMASYVLGSACRTYVLQPSPSETAEGRR